MNKTLLIMAAGMGSRFGGLKQMTGFGPSGETLMDYSIHDALAAGFDKVVFIIRRDFETDFRRQVGSKYEGRVAMDYVFQAGDALPPGFTLPPGRTKPWGTTHAIWCARDRVNEPFVAINGDDFYGKNAYRLMAKHLDHPGPATATPEYCLVGYPILATLSDHGTVARAICQVDGQGYLRDLVERLNLEKSGKTGRFVDEEGNEQILAGDEVVSMNMWGFTPAVFAQLEHRFTRFLAAAKESPGTPECIVSVSVGELIREGAARVRVLPTNDTWFGVTHAKDTPAVKDTIQAMVARGDYPSPIWGKP
jgi:hypothetical protein